MAKTKTSELEADPQFEIRSALNRADKREDTRSKIALYYVIGYISIVAGTIAIFFGVSAFIKSIIVDDLRDMLLAISGILSGPLGFIIGYYFKSHASDNN